MRLRSLWWSKAMLTFLAYLIKKRTSACLDDTTASCSVHVRVVQCRSILVSIFVKYWRVLRDFDDLGLVGVKVIKKSGWCGFICFHFPHSECFTAEMVLSPVEKCSDGTVLFFNLSHQVSFSWTSVTTWTLHWARIWAFEPTVFPWALAQSVRTSTSATWQASILWTLQYALELLATNTLNGCRSLCASLHFTGTISGNSKWYFILFFAPLPVGRRFLLCSDFTAPAIH